MAGTTAFSAAKPGDPPIYNPASKSYFQLLTLTTQTKSWRFAHGAALSRTFKGVHGRLAVIDRPGTHQFILQNFDITRETWIGLRYWCQFRVLEWNGLRAYSPGDPGHFHAWHPQWYRSPAETWSYGTPTICKYATTKEHYLTFYYQPLGERNARWQASGNEKHWTQYLVEYPTGEE